MSATYEPSAAEVANLIATWAPDERARFDCWWETLEDRATRILRQRHKRRYRPAKKVTKWDRVLHADHIAPVIDGGTDLDENKVGACRSCNSSKGTTPLLRFLLRRAA